MGRRQGRRLTGGHALKATDRSAEALQLRRRGYNFQRIADALGYAGRQGAYDAVRRGMREIVREPAEELRQYELHRLETAHEAIWDKVLEGDLASIDRMVKLSERRAKLMGLDRLSAGWVAPTEVKSVVGILLNIISQHVQGEAYAKVIESLGKYLHGQTGEDAQILVESKEVKVDEAQNDAGGDAAAGGSGDGNPGRSA